jgi:hypothetical protein
VPGAFLKWRGILPAAFRRGGRGRRNSGVALTRSRADFHVGFPLKGVREWIGFP